MTLRRVRASSLRGQDVPRQQHLVHDRRRLDERHRRPHVDEALVLHRQPEVRRVAQLVRQREHAARRAGPGDQDVRMHAVGRRAERAGGLADVVGAVDPALRERGAHEVDVVGAHRLHRGEQRVAGLLVGDRRLEAGVQRRAQVAVQHLVQAQHAAAQALVALHVRGQLGADDLEDARVERARHLVRLQQVVLGVRCSRAGARSRRSSSPRWPSSRRRCCCRPSGRRVNEAQAPRRTPVSGWLS